MGLYEAIDNLQKKSEQTKKAGPKRPRLKENHLVRV